MKTLGERNNNPLNIRRVAGQHWQGEVLPQRGSGEGAAFCKFSSMEWGIRAAFVLLRTYSIKCHANCVRDIIQRWAPPTENNTERYIKNVCLWTGFGGLQRLTEEDWPKLVRAMARQEIGVVLDEGVIQRGFDLYRGDPTKAAIKRAQSQTCLNYAEQEQSRPKGQEIINRGFELFKHPR